MSEEKIFATQVIQQNDASSFSSNVEGNPHGEVVDRDAAKLEAMGYQQELKRNFSIWAVLGIGFGLTNSWFGISASLVTGISSGGPMLIVYGIIIVACISTCIGITLSELTSAYPSAGGQYVWTKILAPKKLAPFLSYTCGGFAWAGSVFTSASVTVGIAQEAVGFYALTHPDFTVKTWHVFVAYQLINIFVFLFNCYDKWLPVVGSLALYTSLLSFIVITITVVICSRGNYQSASFVFSEFDNATGWSSSGIAFIVGLINPAWSFSCLDSATHMAEECASPEIIIPKAIMGTVAIGFVTSFCYAIAMFFSIRNLEDILDSNTGVPIFDIYNQALQNKGGAVFLGILVFLTAIGCNIASHTWQARLCWSFARDRGLWGSHYFSQIDKRTGVPFYAHLMSCLWVVVIGCIYLGSTTAYNAMVTACITLLLLSYSIPVACLLYKGRNNIRHGPFWLGKIGLVSNIVVLAWTIFALCFFCFPMDMPVTAGNMNYASVVLAVWITWSVAYWLVRGRRTFIMKSSEDNDEVLDAALNNIDQTFKEE
ncbi:hypothetical protein PACTADRAFT_48100 [Pachysolen tannophilus NRRL Y-2460]|uniref:Amino acid permease/ SLC12A domain-containing protein n=1 Tax=Pachysolen tannophilus NRRL Y-2460 TaxID=669874 RepID=A0A1E4U2T4_PACTA|nr:hypothetical protein PACTADRAFT_48100 [Pachysolen tannophilus NRRL Y-2460]